VSELKAAIERIAKIGPAAAMREDEHALGFSPVRPGEVSWLSAEDWQNDIVISQRYREVRIVAIKAKKPGSGALRRLIAALADANLLPIIVEPMLEMPAILERWRWTGEVIGEGFNKQEIWRPSAKWLRSRKSKSKTGSGE